MLSICFKIEEKLEIENNKAEESYLIKLHSFLILKQKLGFYCQKKLTTAECKKPTCMPYVSSKRYLKWISKSKNNVNIHIHQNEGKR